VKGALTPGGDSRRTRDQERPPRQVHFHFQIPNPDRSTSTNISTDQSPPLGSGGVLLVLKTGLWYFFKRRPRVILLGIPPRVFSFGPFHRARTPSWLLPYWHVNSRIIFQPESYSDCNEIPPLFVGLVCCRETAPQCAPPPCLFLFPNPSRPLSLWFCCGGTIVITALGLGDPSEYLIKCHSAM
jgi:hypothetical protein